MWWCVRNITISLLRALRLISSTSVLVNVSSTSVFTEVNECHTHLCSRLLELSTATCHTIYTFKYSGYMFEATYRRALECAMSRSLSSAVVSTFWDETTRVLTWKAKNPAQLYHVCQCDEAEQRHILYPGPRRKSP